VLPEQLGFHCYAVNTHPDKFVLELHPKKILDPPMKEMYFHYNGKLFPL